MVINGWVWDWFWQISVLLCMCYPQKGWYHQVVSLACSLRTLRHHVTRACVYACGWIACEHVTFLTHTPPPTSGGGWYTQTLQTQIGRSSWPHRYNKKEMEIISGKTMKCLKNEQERLKLTHHQGWAEWAHWWTGHQSYPVQTPLRCWAWKEGPSASAPAEITAWQSGRSTTSFVLIEIYNMWSLSECLTMERSMGNSS